MASPKNPPFPATRPALANAKEVPLAQLSIPDAIACAVNLQQQGYLPAAQTIYERVLAAVPNHPDALHYSGVLARQSGDRDRAIKLIREALRVAPGYADAWNNLGNILLEMEQFDEAAACWRRVIEIKPDHADTYNNLGVLLKEQGQLAEAEAMLQKAIAIRPEFFDAYHNIGNVYRQQRRHHEASKAYSTAIVLNPEHPEARRMLGIALYTLGRTEEAAQHYRLWLEREPDNPVAAHMLAACSGTDIPSRASDSYVRQIFDSFSNSFDAKLSNLEYRAPELVRDAVSRRIENPAQDHDVLDLGCGTGLCGPLLKPYAKRLTGVDLSAGMLAKARARRHYDDLVEAELTRYLNDQNKNCDLIVCADTLCYFGELTRVFTALSGALRPNGLFVFTVELLSEEGSDANFKLDPSGRYSHAQPYVKHELESAGLAIKEIAPGNLRMENGLPVKGLVVTATLE